MMHFNTGFDMNNLSQLFGSGLSGETMELFGESLSLFYAMLTDPRDAPDDDRLSKSNKRMSDPDTVYDPKILFQESMGGVTCIWGSVNA